MAIDIGSVLSVYKKTGGIIDSADSGNAVGGIGGAGGTSFADALSSFASDKISALKGGESAAMNAATGKADLASVVTAIDGAEIALTEVTTIRDKVISAYQAITSSAI